MTVRRVDCGALSSKSQIKSTVVYQAERLHPNVRNDREDLWHLTPCGLPWLRYNQFVDENGNVIKVDPD